MFKNTASQKLTVLAVADAGHGSLDAGDRVTGDSANITLKVEQDDDGVRSASNDVNPTETEDGQYVFDLTQAETNGDKLTFYPESSTAGVQVYALPSAVIYTRPPNFSDMGIETDGHVHGDLKQWLGTAPAALTDTDKVQVSLQHGATDIIDSGLLATTAVEEIRNSITGGAYALDTDVNGRVRHVEGTGAGELDTTLGLLAWNAAWDAEVESEVNDGLVAFFTSSAQLVDDIWDEDIVAAHGTGDTAGLILSQLTHRALATGWSTDITADSVFDQLADDGTAVYDRTTDSLQAIADGSAPDAATIADAVWDEDIVAAHGTADTAGFLLSILTGRALGTGISTDVVDGSVIGRIVDDGTATYDRTTDSLQAQRDNVGTASGVDIAADIAENQTDLDAILLDLTDGTVVVGTINADVVNASALNVDAVEEIRNAITGGAYSLDTDVNGRVRHVEGTGSGELDSSLGLLAWNPAWDAEVESEVNDGLVAFFTSSAQLVDDIWDEDIVAAHGTGDTAGYLLSLLTARALPVDWATNITADSVFDQLADDGTASYDRTTDSLQALRDLVPDAVWDLTDGIESGITPREATRAIAAKAAGLISGAGTGTEVVKGIGQSAVGTTRMTATVDGSGNITNWGLNL